MVASPDHLLDPRHYPERTIRALEAERDRLLAKVARYETMALEVEAERDAARCTIDKILDGIKFLEEELSAEIPWRVQ